jgi:DNA primase
LGKLEAAYPYTDAHGELLAEKLRFEGKVFLWRRPQAGGGWLWRVDRASLPLFRLHLLVASETAILVEGEKDALNLSRVVERDVAVTTAPNGAKSWRPEFAECFRAKQVWIIPDFDEPGRVYSQSVASQLVRVARSVRVVSVAPSKDVSDYLLEHTPTELSGLFRNARLWR